MKYTLALCVLTVLSVFSYTAASNSFRAGKDVLSTPDSSYSGDAQLAYTVEGRKFNIKSYLNTGGKTTLVIYLNEVAKKPGGMVRINLTNYLPVEVFNILVSDKGTTHIHYKPGFTNGPTPQGIYMIGIVNYYANDATVQITTIDDKHVTGTFSGSFISDNKKTIYITNGNFDLPFKARS